MLALTPSCRPGARRPPAPRRALARSAPISQTAPSTLVSSSFAEAASGEWEGAAAAFNRTGSPIELPPRYVPEAFREWGVEVADWQTQCSTEVLPVPGGDAISTSFSLSYRLKRLLPSVGCEADATAFVDEGVSARLGGGGAEIGGVEAEVEARFLPAFLPDGSYALAPPCLPIDPSSKLARFEVSLPLPPASCVAADGSVSPRRVRAVLSVAADPTSTSVPPSPVLVGVELFSEKRYGPYAAGRDSLAGCGGGVGPFARKDRLEEGVVERGDWRVEGGVRVSAGAPSSSSSPAPDPARGSALGRLLLPLGAWAAVRACEGGVVVEAGVVADGGAGDLVRRTGAASFDAASGALQSVELVAETAGGGRLE